MSVKYDFGEVPGTIKARIQADRYNTSLERYREFIHVWDYLHKPYTTKDEDAIIIDEACKVIHQRLCTKLSDELSKLQKVNDQWLADHKM